MNKFGGYENHPFLAELYDFTPDYDKRPDVDFFLSFSSSTSGKTLELGCGTGRILIPTAVAGCLITGLDISEYMLAKCREKLGNQPEEVQKRVQLISGNMVNFKLKETYSLITTPFRPFQHLLSVDDQLACLQCSNRHLLKGGKLILDLFQTDPKRINNPEYMEETEDFPNVELPDGRKFRRTHRVSAFHQPEQYNDVELIFYVTHKDGKIERLVQAFPFRYFFRYEVEHLLSRCGFKVLELYRDYDKSPISNDSPEMIFVGEKCEDLK